MSRQGPGLLYWLYGLVSQEGRRMRVLGYAAKISSKNDAIVFHERSSASLL